jgi:circadian clock protein KaiC
VLDTIETLFGGLSDEGLLRSEMRRLFRWLKEREVTAVITAERGDGTLTRHGIEEYVSDCVILLDNRVIDQIATRRLRIVKYRGSAHGTNEYPFLIDSAGVEVVPITAAGLDYKVSSERISTGIPDLDAMVGGGLYRGSSVLVSGPAGSGKSSLAAHFAVAACRRGERCIYFTFEESQDQVVRNMASIGLDLASPLAAGTLAFHATRPSVYGLESHLAFMQRAVRERDPEVVIFDGIATFLTTGSAHEVRALFVRLIDFLKGHEVTTVYTSLSVGEGSEEMSEVGISSLIDSWLLLREVESGGERNRALYLLKSRGMRHSRQVREQLLTDHGIELPEVFLGPDGILVGSARLAEEARQHAEAADWEQEVERRRRDLLLKREEMEARVATLHHEFKVEEEQLERLLSTEERRRRSLASLRKNIARDRQHDMIGDRLRTREERP